jgi:hypothetical protein
MRTPIDDPQAQALPESIGQSLIVDQSYFPQQISSQQPHSGMSQSYLQMKQDQDTRTLQEKADSNPLAIERLKREQATETQKNLQMQWQLSTGPHGLSQFDRSQVLSPYDRTQTGTQVASKPIAYNAQGQSVNDTQTLFHEKHNKYRHLKEMSPEMLNKMYGRQSDQSVAPPSALLGDGGDVYDQTSCFKVKYEPPKEAELQTQLKQRQDVIMKQKSRLGIQSFNGNSTGTSLNDAYVGSH